MTRENDVLGNGPPTTPACCSLVRSANTGLSREAVVRVRSCFLSHSVLDLILSQESTSTASICITRRYFSPTEIRIVLWFESEASFCPAQMPALLEVCTGPAETSVRSHVRDHPQIHSTEPTRQPPADTSTAHVIHCLDQSPTVLNAPSHSYDI